MAQRVEDRLHELELLRADPLAASSLAQLRRTLADRSNLIAAKAAALIEEFEIQALAGDVARAFDRFLEGGAKLDPQCWAKNALIKALKRLNHQDHERYLRAFRYTQREPVFGGSEDTAVTLRGEAALALIQCRDLRDFDLLNHLVESWADPEPNVRIDIARAIGSLERPEAVLLLKTKILCGDRECRVVGYCFEALLGAGGAGQLPFVLRFVHEGSEELRWEALGAMAATHLAEALDQLIEWIEKGPQSLAERTLDALAPYRLKPPVATRVAGAVAQRNNPSLNRIFARDFSTMTR